MDRACSIRAENWNACKILVGTRDGKRLLGRPRCGWEDNIKMDFRGIR
jgi:uncharacterized C2H2 Zn-finger protein